MAKYFEPWEFECKHCGELPENGMNPTLVARLDQLREWWGAPIHVSSAYRCDYWNMVNGGVPNSQHKLGNAADIWVDDDDYEAFYQFVLDSKLFSGVGYYPNEQFVHVDVRDNNINYYIW